MYAQLFRSFYLVFAGLFAWLMVGAVLAAAIATVRGEPATVATASVLTAMCAVLVTRAARYMRE